MFSEEKESEPLQQRVQVLYHIDRGNALVLDVNWNMQERKAVFRNEFNEDSLIHDPRVTVRQVLHMRLVDMHHVSVNDIMLQRPWEWNAILDSPVEEVATCQIEVWSYMGQVGVLEHSG